jgi:hypothetical protein
VLSSDISRVSNVEGNWSGGILLVRRTTTQCTRGTNGGPKASSRGAKRRGGMGLAGEGARADTRSADERGIWEGAVVSPSKYSFEKNNMQILLVFLCILAH